MNPKGLPLFEQESEPKMEPAEYLAKCRKLAVDLARSQGYVTISDVHKKFQRPDYIHPNIDGAIFKVKKVFKQFDTRISETPSRNGGIERIWTLV